MKYLFVALIAAILVSCNSVGEKDTLVARVGSESVYQEDFDLMYKFVNAETEEKKQKARGDVLLRAALVSKVKTETTSAESLWVAFRDVQKNQMLYVAYDYFYLSECLGYSEKELLKFYELHKGDSVFVGKRFVDVRRELAELLYIKQNEDSLENYIAKMLPKYNKPMRISALLHVGDSSRVKFLNDMTNKGFSAESLGVVEKVHFSQGDERGIFKDSVVREALFGKDSMKVNESRAFVAMDSIGKRFFVLKLIDRTPAVLAKRVDEIDNLRWLFVNIRRDFLLDEMKKIMKEHEGIVIENLELADLKGFYEKNLNLFVTVPGYELYHIARKDSTELLQLVHDVTNEDDFIELSKKWNVKSETALKEGFLGAVKNNYALPYGIGLMPGLFAELSGKREGFISSVYYSGTDSLYHVFYVSAVLPSMQKSYERAKMGIDAVYRENLNLIDSMQVLISRNGVPLVREMDLRVIFKAETGMAYNKVNHERLVENLAQFAALHHEMLEKGVDRNWEFRGIERNTRANLYTYFYEDELQRRGVFAKTGNEIPDRFLKYAYLLYGHAKYLKGFEKNKMLVAKTYRDVYRSERTQRMLVDAWNSVQSFFYDRSLEGFVPESDSKRLISEADSLARVQDFEGAVNKMDRLVRLYHDVDTLYSEALSRMAQYFSDAQKFEESVKCNELLENQLPSSSEAETAMFSRAFVLSENLQRNAEAQAVLEEFFKKYPESSLKESAQWLLDNIKSNGKKAQELMKKIETQE